MKKIIQKYQESKHLVFIISLLFVIVVFALLRYQENYSKSLIKNKFEFPSLMAGNQFPFILNEGHSDENVEFYAITFDGTIFVTKKR